MNKEEIDILKKIEEITKVINNKFNEKGRGVFSRYPLTFALLVVFGVTLVTQGIKDMIDHIPFLNDQPFVMLGLGLIVLIITGTLYRKLDK